MIKIKASELIMSLTRFISENGDKEVIVDLLTENQSNLVEITGNCCGGNYVIECDINDVKDFKKNFK